MDYILTHHGIKGQKWGIRRFQNSDGTRTAAGKKRYNTSLFDTSVAKGNAYSQMKNAKRGSPERKQAKEEYKGYKKALIKEQKKARYNAEVDRGKDPNKFMNSQVDRLVKKGMNKDEAELKVYGRKEMARMAGLSVVAGGISAVNPVAGSGAVTGLLTSSNFGRRKLYDAAISQEIRNGESAYKALIDYVDTLK